MKKKIKEEGNEMTYFVITHRAGVRLDFHEQQQEEG